MIPLPHFLPVGVGALLGVLASHGISIGEADSVGLTAACIAVAIAIAACYAADRAAEQSRQPWLAAIGRFMLGGIARTPVYLPSRPPRIATTTNLPDNNSPRQCVLAEDGWGASMPPGLVALIRTLTVQSVEPTNNECWQGTDSLFSPEDCRQTATQGTARPPSVRSAPATR